MRVEPAKPGPSTPTCRRCGRFLRTPEELQRGYCSRCPLPTQAADDRSEIFCCGSDPPCPSCPYVVGWGDADAGDIARWSEQ